MSDYVAEVKGTLNLADITSAIVREEATGAEFQKSVVAPHEGRITNLVTFKDLPAGTRPGQDIVLKKQNEAAPQGKTTIWTGVMLVSGTNEIVVAYR